MKQQVLSAYGRLNKTNIVSNFLNLSGIQLSNTLLVILLIPVITRRIGIEQFGLMMFASRFSQLAGAIVNYGTNQSGVRDVASNLKDDKAISLVFFNTLFIRAGIFLLFCLAMVGLYTTHASNYLYLLFSVPIVLAEVFNPLFFFIGTEKLRIFNVANLISNVASIVTVIILIKSPKDAIWVNFILGTSSVIAYFLLLVYVKSQFKLSFSTPLKNNLIKIIKDNFYLNVNNISVHLQQSVIIFALEQWGTPSILGAYSLCDRIIGQCRNLLITISTAIYPNAVQVYNQSLDLWNKYRRKTKYMIAALYFAGSILLIVLSDFIIYTLSKEHNETAVIFLRTMAIVPTLSALNVLNVLDQLLKNNTIYIFRIAVILLVISFFTTVVLLKTGNNMLTGAFTVIIEASALLMYEYAITKPSLKYA